MKKLFYSMALPMVACLGFALTSCSDDDDNNGGGIPDLPTPTYESSSAKYEMASGSPYRSIEFTASGNYVIVTDGASSYYSASPAAKQTSVGGAIASGMFRKSSAPVSRAYFDGIYYGTYTKTGDNQYNLQGFGTITVSTSGDNAYSLTVTTSAGSQTLSASKVVADKNSDRTNALCRTWNFDKINLKVWVNGSKKYDKTVNANKLNEFFEDWDDEGLEEDEIPRQVIFTKSGTYMVLYGTGDNSNNSLDISTWGWEDESKGILRYSWNLDNLYDPDDSGLITTSFSGKNMTIVEDYEETEDGVKYRSMMTYYFTPAK